MTRRNWDDIKREKGVTPDPQEARDIIAAALWGTPVEVYMLADAAIRALELNGYALAQAAPPSGGLTRPWSLAATLAHHEHPEIGDMGLREAVRDVLLSSPGFTPQSAVNERMSRLRDAYAALAQAAPPSGLDASCDCVPGHRCDCQDWRTLLRAVVVGQEYDRQEAEGIAAEALGLVWDDGPGQWVAALSPEPTETEADALARKTGYTDLRMDEPAETER